MKKKILAFTLILVSFTIIFAGCDFDLLEEDVSEEGQQEVRYREGEFVAEIAKENTLQQSKALSTSETYLKVFEYPDKSREEVEETLLAEGYQVKSVFPNLEFSVTKEEVQATRNDLPWNLEMANIPKAYSHFADKLEEQEDVKIAVLDTGIDPQHESLEGFVDEGLTGNFTDDEPEDVHGHGTHVAGIIAAHSELAGVMEEATLINIKVLSDSGFGTYDGILAGIDYAVEIGADVVNMSLGGFIPAREENAIRIYDKVLESALNRGTLVVAAAGNSSATISSGRGGMYPAASPYSLAVGASNEEKRVANYSNFGDDLHLVAPGSAIYSALPGDRYATMSGTSMAAPHVAGLAGLLRAVDSELAAEDKFDIIKGAGNQDILAVEYEEQYTGSGHMDVYKAINHYYIGDYLPD